MTHQYYLPAGSAAKAPFDLVITPESAGWSYCSLRLLRLAAGEPVTFETGGEEMILLPMSGSVSVTIGGETLEIQGRSGVFAAVTDFAYLPVNSKVTAVSESGGLFALPGTTTDVELPFRYGPAGGVSIELRGAGSCSRQVNNFATPAAFETAKMIACEVLTPAGNWSSYPPHKHDETTDSESELEEIYFFKFRPVAPATPDPVPDRGAGFHRVYGTPERPISVLEEVQDGDTVLVPHGWHGPSIASPSHDMYYLNVMAGPELERTWKISDDPAHGWIRATWKDQELDSRVPFYSQSKA